MDKTRLLSKIIMSFWLAQFSAGVKAQTSGTCLTIEVKNSRDLSLVLGIINYNQINNSDLGETLSLHVEALKSEHFSHRLWVRPGFSTADKLKVAFNQLFASQASLVSKDTTAKLVNCPGPDNMPGTSLHLSLGLDPL